MLTLTFEQPTNESPVVSAYENLPTYAEISRRVLLIRSKWSIQERIRRRNEAERRFEELVDTLMCAEAA